MSAITGADCPICGKHLKMIEPQRRFLRRGAYFSILTTIEEMQVVRMFLVTKDMKKKQKANNWISEVIQHFIDPKGKVVSLLKRVNGFTGYSDNWVYNSDLEVRGNSCGSNQRFLISPYKIYPTRKIQPILRRNGFKGHFHDFSPQELFSLILHDKMAETLLKTGQIPWLKHYSRYSKIKEYWPSIKICIRNGYKVNDVSTWVDYISLLKFFKKDLLNPKYVCPTNLNEAHDRLVNKKREIDRKMRKQELRDKMELEQKEFIESKGKFLNLCFSDGDLVVKPIDTIEKFMIEGDELSHCVFTNEYYKKPDSLIFSATIKNKPVETIEFSLKDLTVIQARGKGNKKSNFHDPIISLFNQHKHQIASIVSLNT